MASAVEIVRLDKAVAWRTMLLTVLLVWPILLFGRPTYLPDSVSYLKGGQAAVEFALGKISSVVDHSRTAASRPQPTETTSAAPAAPGAALKGVRSLLYSVLAYTLRWPGFDMTGLAVAQMICAAFVSAVATLALGATRGRDFAIIAAFLAFATPLAIITAFAIPDIFAALVIAGTVLFATRLPRLSTGVRLSLAAITCFSISAHASIPPLAAGLVGVCMVWLVIRRQEYRPSVATWAWLILPPLLGAGLTAAVNLTAFDDPGLAAKHYPLALARSVSDGPARWYLERHCKTEHYAVCEVFPNHIPAGVKAFVFNKTGLDGLATPEQMDRIRAEEREIVIRAALAYPHVEAYNLSTHLAAQLVHFGMGNTGFRNRVVAGPDGVPTLEAIVPDKQQRPEVVAFQWWIYLAMIGVIIWGGWQVRRLDGSSRAPLMLVIYGILGNTVIVVVFSGMADRYHARVVWLLPLFALASVFAYRQRFRASMSDQAVASAGSAGRHED